jgi:hypothetical protein
VQNLGIELPNCDTVQRSTLLRQIIIASSGMWTIWKEVTLDLTLTIRPRIRLTLGNRISKSLLALIAIMKFSGPVGFE